MGAPVWVLSVDLQAKTATFQSGMADAARSARGSFTEIGSGSKEMGERVGGSMTEARHGVMMLGEEFGVHLPRGLTTFIASLGPVGAAMEAAFPFLAIILGATLLLEHLAKLHEAGAKLTEDQKEFGVAAQRAFDSLDEKILQAEIRSDELKNDHLGALKLQLELIDKQSLGELAQEFDKLASHADAALKDIQSRWYTLGAGSDGVKSSLHDFQMQYDALTAKGDKDGAAKLLQDKFDRESRILEMQRQAIANMHTPIDSPDHAAGELKYHEAINALKQYGVGISNDEIASEKIFVDLLRDHLEIQQRVAHENTLNRGNAALSAGKADGKDAAKAAEELARAEQEAVNHMGEIIRAANERMSAATAEDWRNRIAETKEGSAARLAVIDAGIKDELANGMEGEAAYRELLTARVTLTRQFGEEQAALQRAAESESISESEKMAELRLASERSHDNYLLQMHRMTAAQMTEIEVQRSLEETALQMTAATAQMANLDKTAADYANRLKALEDQKAQIAQEGADKVTAIREKAAEQNAAVIMSAEHRALSTMASGLAQSITGHQTWAKMLNSFGAEAAEGMVRNSLLMIMGQEKERLSAAKTAAASAYKTGVQWGGPAGIVLGPVFAAAAFTGAMAFQDGGIVPGVGRGDIVPAMLEPGEGVLPKQLMDRLSTGGNTGPVNHYSIHAPVTLSASSLDSDGVEAVLNTHGDKFQSHFENVIRKLNR